MNRAESRQTARVPSSDFWARLEKLAASRQVVIDRPKGTAHPRYPEIIYPLDYGYLEGTTGGDGNEIDVWRGSKAPAQIMGVICTVDIAKGDAEIKLLIGCTEEEIEVVNRFHNNRDHMSGIVVKRVLDKGLVSEDASISEAQGEQEAQGS